MVTMSEKTPEVKVGQVWKRKRDGAETVVVSTSAGTGLYPAIRHRIGRRVWDTDRAEFTSRYELLKETPDA